MSKTIRYFVQAGTNFIDFSLDHAPEATLQGSEIIVKGTNGVDVIYVDGRFNLDFAESLSGTDILLLKGQSSDFVAAQSGSSLKLSRSDGSYVLVSGGDQLVFEDGAVQTSAWLTALEQHQSPPTLSTDLHSSGSVSDLAAQFCGQEPLTATVMGFGRGAEGSTFAQVQPGMKLVLKGSNGADVVYVKPGTVVDFSDSLTGMDTIYLTGQWSQYSKAFSGNSLKLTMGGEQVLVSSGDRLVFADGSVPVATVMALLPGNPGTNELGDDWNPNQRTPGVMVEPVTLSLLGFEDSGMKQLLK